ncbi:MAG: FG-GAP-like repeat-containing protein [Armatimonadota bacterium]
MRPLLIFALIVIAVPGLAQQDATLIHGCETLNGVTVTTGKEREGTLLVIARAAEYVTEGWGSIRIGGHSPADATGSTYCAIDLTIPPTDFTDRALVFDAGTTLPVQTQTLYARGFDEAGNCVLSWQSWSNPLAEQMKTFVLVPGRDSSGLKWEPDVAVSDDRSAVVRLRFFTGTRAADADFNTYIDNIRVAPVPPAEEGQASGDGSGGSGLPLVGAIAQAALARPVGPHPPAPSPSRRGGADGSARLDESVPGIRHMSFTPSGTRPASRLAMALAWAGIRPLWFTPSRTRPASRLAMALAWAGIRPLWFTPSGTPRVPNCAMPPQAGMRARAGEARTAPGARVRPGTASGLPLVAAIAQAVLAQAADEVALNSCDSVDDMTIDLGGEWPGTVLEVNTDARFVTEGVGSAHLAATSPADATGNSYLCLGLTIPPTDFTGDTTLRFDAASSTPGQSEALYVRGLNAANECVLSWTSWGGLLSDRMQTFELHPGMSYAGLAWEADAVAGREPLGVVKLRIYTGTHNPGQRFDIFVDNVRTGRSQLRSFNDVTEAKPLYPDTMLVEGGEPRAIIVAPEGQDWRALAGEVAAMIEAASGARLPIVGPEQAGDDVLAGTNAIVLGSIINNRALLYPYSHQLTFADGAYPGAGGYEVRTVNDPWGTGRNLIAIGASDIQGARAGLEALRPYIAAGETLVVPQVLEVKLTGEAEAAYANLFTAELDEEWAESQRAACEDHLVRAGTRGLFSRAEGQGLNYALTGRPEYAQMYVWMIKRTYQSYLSSPDTYGGPWGMDSDFHIYTNIPAWDNVEECPAISAEDRLEVTRILFRWVSELGPSKSASPTSRRVRFNHQTFPALGCLYAGQYFSRYYHAIEGEEWIRVADGTFQYQLDAFKPHCDCNSYQWLTLNHTMMYCLARPDLRYFENGNARLNADYAILTMNNLGYQVPYGDIGGWGPLGTELRILRMAEWYYRDGRAQWAIDRKMQVTPRLALSSYSMPPDHPAVEPTDLLGTRGWALDDLWYDSFGGTDAVERAQAFDKVSFRSSFAPEAAYLLLDGLSLGGHGHLDGNAILQWTENGRVWLADVDYIKSLPKYHNGVLILRDGQSAGIPGYAELENLADLQSVGASQTVMRDYAGVDWHRNVIWLRDRLFVVADRMVARQPGDYSFRAVWQTIGDTELDGSTLRVHQQGQHAAIAMTADTRCILNEDEYTGKNWASYPYIDEPVVKSMQGIIDAHLEAGEQVVLFTVLHASGEEPSPVQVRRVGGNAIAITGAGESILVAVRDESGGIVLPGAASVRGEMVVMTPARMCGIGLTEINALGQTRTMPEGADLEADIAAGQIMAYTPARTALDTQQVAEALPLGEAADPAEVRGLMEVIIASAPPAVGPPPVGADAPAMAELWRFIDRPGSFLLTGNAGVPEAVDAVESLTATPEPLELNVFSQAAGMNTLSNAVDGAVANTEDGVMWDDDQEVTLKLHLRDSYHLERMRLAAWFATSSSRNKLFQLARIRLLASNDGFAADERVLLDVTDEQEHGNWGAPGHAPHEYEYPLDADARDLRLVLTPRPGTAVYLAELELWGSGEGLEELAIASGAGPTYLFNSVHCADIDGDGVDEVLAGSSNGKVYCLGADGQVRWIHDCDAEVNSVTTVDLAGDGRPAVVVGAMNGLVIALRGDGERLWTYEVPYYKRVPHVRTVFGADLAGDGTEAVIAGADSWRYYAIDAQGEELWHYESVHGSTAGAAADVDGDGRDEVIAGTEYYWWHVINPDGSRRFQARTAGGPCANAAAAADIDGDGRDEVVFGGADTNVQVYNADGERIWLFNTGDEVSDLACADIDGDGADEVLVSSLSFNVYCLEGDATGWTVKWRTPLPNQTRTLTVLAGEPPRVAAGCDDGAVYALGATDGALLARFQTAGRIIDLAAAGLGEVIAASEDGFIYALRVPERTP